MHERLLVAVAHSKAAVPVSASFGQTCSFRFAPMTVVPGRLTVMRM
jgi:hypothetical protein